MSSPIVKRFAETHLPTEYGTFRVIAYKEEGLDQEHLAIVSGEVEGKGDVPCRVHSECLTGEVLHSLKCDCREQLDLALRLIAQPSFGAVFYLRQEGRGIGLGNKLRAYALQHEGHDTVDANRMLGFADDLRRYHSAAFMVQDLGIRSVRLMTNNPAKVDGMRAEGIEVSGRLTHSVAPNAVNRGYLETKRDRMGHMVVVPEDLKKTGS